MEPLRSEERYQELAAKWLNNTISSSEAEEFAHWYNSAQTDEIRLPDNYAANEEELKSRIFDSVNKQIFPVEGVSYNNFRKWYVAAAVITVLLAVGLYFYPDKPDVQNLASEPVKVEILKSQKPLNISETPEKNIELPVQKDF